jgi:hypothetical protein
MASVNDLATTNLWNFIAFFTVFFVYICFQIISGSQLKMRDIYYTIFIFYVITFIIQVSSNAYLTSRKEICGKTDLGVSFSSTIYPWIFIYGLTIILIIFIPGWLRIFSNTFGLYCAKANGLNTLLTEKIFTSANRESVSGISSGTQPNVELLKTIDSVYNDPSLLINELDPRDCEIIVNEDKTSRFDWKSLNKIISSGIIKEISDTETIKQLHNNMVLKEAVGFSVWILLSGIISVVVSTNILLNEGCKKGASNNYNNIFK